MPEPSSHHERARPFPFSGPQQLQVSALCALAQPGLRPALTCLARPRNRSSSSLRPFQRSLFPQLTCTFLPLLGTLLRAALSNINSSRDSRKRPFRFLDPQQLQVPLERRLLAGPTPPPVARAPRREGAPGRARSLAPPQPPREPDPLRPLSRPFPPARAKRRDCRGTSIYGALLISGTRARATASNPVCGAEAPASSCVVCWA